MNRIASAVTLALLAAACAREPLRDTPKSEIRTSPVVRQTLPEPQPQAPPPVATTSNPEAAKAPTLASVAPATAAPSTAGPPPVPSGTLYVCAAIVDGQPKHTAIEYEPRVKTLCAKHPEMGVCQYEREQCRASGGRVYDAKGVEITKQIEAEYDKKVMRVRFRAG